MVETQVKYVVVGHYSRIGHAQRLAALLDAYLLIDDGNHWRELESPPRDRMGRRATLPGSGAGRRRATCYRIYRAGG